MKRLLERNIAEAAGRLVILAPSDLPFPRSLEHVIADSRRHTNLLHHLQRLRGSVYAEEGAIRQTQLTSDGRHEMADDLRAWHLLTLDDEHRISGCISYREHDGRPPLEQLRAGRTPLAVEPRWKDRVRAAVDAETARAEGENIAYAEVGGWAVAKNAHFADCLLLILGTYSLSQLVGGALVIATATVRHSSAKILSRMGGAPLVGDGVVIPRYFDPQYNCEMELLRFDTRQPGPKFVRLVDTLRSEFSKITMVGRDVDAMARITQVRATVSQAAA
jgi:hypothetical protein